MRRLACGASVVGWVVLGLTGAAFAAERTCLPEVGRWPYGPAEQVAVSGPHVFFNSGTVLVAADASNPTHPHVLGRLTFDAEISDIAAGDGLVFVATAGDGLWVVDFTVPTLPVLSSQLEIGDVTHVQTSGRTAFAAQAEAGLWIIDAADPVDPVPLGFYEPLPADPSEPPDIKALKVAGDRAFIATSAFDLVILDVASPSAPVRISAFDDPDMDRVTDLDISGGLAYVAAANKTMILDIGDEENPAAVGRIDGAVQRGKVVVDDGVLFSSGGLDVHLFDVSDPAAPRYLAHTLGGRTATTEAVVANGWVFASTGRDGVRVFDARNQTSIFAVGSASEVGRADEAVYVEPYVFVTETSEISGGLSVVDVSNPTSPSVVGFLDLPPFAGDIAVSGDYAYVLDSLSGVRLVDIANPAAPAEIGFLEISGGVRDVAVYESHVLVSDNHSTLHIIDVSDPLSPIESGVIQFPVAINDLVVEGGLLYVLLSQYLKVFDLSTPESPLEIGSEAIWDADIGELAVDGDSLFIISSYELLTVSIADPTNPEYVGWARAEFAGDDIEAREGRVYIPITSGTPSTGGLYVFDVRDLAHPEILGFTLSIGAGRAVVIGDDFAYLATKDSGLVVVDVGSPWMPPMVADLSTPDETEWIAARSDLVVVAQQEGLHVLALDDDGHPAEVGYAEGDWLVDEVEIEGDLVFVKEPNAVSILSVADPISPLLVGHLELDYLDDRQIEVDGSCFAVLTDRYRVGLFDASDPSRPVLAGGYDTPVDWSGHLVIADGVAFLPDNDFFDPAIEIVDVSDPVRPTLLIAYHLPDRNDVVDLLASDGFAYVSEIGDQVSGLRILDVRDPVSPAQVGWIESEIPEQIEILGSTRNRVVCSQLDGQRAWMVELTHPASPVVFDVSTRDLDGVGHAAAGGYLHIAKDQLGLAVFDLSARCQQNRRPGGRVEP